MKSIIRRVKGDLFECKEKLTCKHICKNYTLPIIPDRFAVRCPHKPTVDVLLLLFDIHIEIIESNRDIDCTIIVCSDDVISDVITR